MFLHIGRKGEGERNSPARPHMFPIFFIPARPEKKKGRIGPRQKKRKSALERASATEKTAKVGEKKKRGAARLLETEGGGFERNGQPPDLLTCRINGEQKGRRFR